MWFSPTLHQWGTPHGQNRTALKLLRGLLVEKRAQATPEPCSMGHQRKDSFAKNPALWSQYQFPGVPRGGSTATRPPDVCVSGSNMPAQKTSPSAMMKACSTVKKSSAKSVCTSFLC
eukprot:PhM_4_TR1321/c3_g1_i6/m.101099